MNHILFVIDGVKYKQHGWLGCQLISYEWRRLRAGTYREFDLSSSIRLYVFTTGSRSITNWFRVPTTWAVSCTGSHDKHVERINDLIKQLKNI